MRASCLSTMSLTLIMTDCLRFERVLRQTALQKLCTEVLLLRFLTQRFDIITLCFKKPINQTQFLWSIPGHGTGPKRPQT